MEAGCFEHVVSAQLCNGFAGQGPPGLKERGGSLRLAKLQVMSIFALVVCDFNLVLAEGLHRKPLHFNNPSHKRKERGTLAADGFAKSMSDFGFRFPRTHALFPWLVGIVGIESEPRGVFGVVLDFAPPQ